MSDVEEEPIALGRYDLFTEVARGGMAAVYLGRQRGAVGFSRTVAIKRLHPHFARDPEFVAMFLDEARLAARIRHPNVVGTLDVGTVAGELFLVMELVLGASLSSLARSATEPPPVRVAAAIILDVLHGLEAAHQARGENGAPLDIVHRDISPQNVLVGVEGTARLLDFGIAKASSRLNASTGQGTLKGKLPYMAPELVRGLEANRATDIYATGVVLWELLAGQGLFLADNQGAVLERLLYAKVPAPSSLRTDRESALDGVVAAAISRDPSARFDSAAAMAEAVERAVRPASRSEVSAWVRSVGGDLIRARESEIAAVERGSQVPVSVDNVLRELAAESTPRGLDDDGAPSDVATRPTELSDLGAGDTQLQMQAAAPPSPPRRARWPWALGVIAVAALGAVSFGAPPWRSVALLAPAPSRSPSESPRAELQPAPPVSASSAAVTLTPSASSASRTLPKWAAVPHRATPDCSLGYRVDENGKHVYLRECMPKTKK